MPENDALLVGVWLFNLIPDEMHTRCRSLMIQSVLDAAATRIGFFGAGVEGVLMGDLLDCSGDARKTRAVRRPARVSICSVLARQVDYPVDEIECDFIQWKICVLDLLGEHDLAVAIIACKRSGSVGAYAELPDLEFLGGNSPVVGLNGGDFVQKPICLTVLGNVLRAVSVENVAVDPVPIPAFAAGELREVAFAESLRRHVFASFLDVTPRRGRERQQEQPHGRGGRHRQTWNK